MYEPFVMATATNDFKDLRDASPANIAITSTVPPLQLKGLVETFSKMYPNSTIRIIAQKGRADDMAKLLGVEAVEALPSGMFSMRKIFQPIYSKVKNLKVDLLVIAYNNADSIGYFPFKLFSLMCGAKRSIGVFYPKLARETRERSGVKGAAEYEEISFKRALLTNMAAFGAIHLADIILMIVVMIIFTGWSFFRWFRLNIAKALSKITGS